MEKWFPCTVSILKWEQQPGWVQTKVRVLELLYIFHMRHFTQLPWGITRAETALTWTCTSSGLTHITGHQVTSWLQLQAPVLKAYFKFYMKVEISLMHNNLFSISSFIYMFPSYSIKIILWNIMELKIVSSYSCINKDLREIRVIKFLVLKPIFYQT